MTISELIKSASKDIKGVSDTSILDAEVLLGFVLNKSREYLISYSEEKVAKRNKNKFWKLIERRKNHEPISQIINRKEFFGLEFYINKNVLTPRPETEIIVEKILKITKDIKNGTIIDIGTGSGCIAISCAKNTSNKINVIALDKCKRALSVAEKNAKILNAKVEFIQSDLLKNLQLEKLDKPYVFAANLPYVFDKDDLPEDVKLHEPAKALYGGARGMDLYKELFKQIAQDFSNFKAIVFECDLRQTEDLEELKQKYFDDKKLTFYKDLSKKIRGGVIE